ncbi:MAG: Do family serine endopeptidase [Hyphomicrobiaceae bacterium]
MSHKLPLVTLCNKPRLVTGMAGLAIALLSGMLLALNPAQAQKREVPSSRQMVQYSFAPVVRKTAPAVVNVYVSSRVKTVTSPFAGDPFFERFFGESFGMPRERVQRSLGSGVIVSPDGVIVTNAHVVKSHGETEIRVALADKREFDATILSRDEKSDIAVIKIKAKGERFDYLQFEDSDSLEVGDLVLAIGNPFGVGQTVTSGIVSALARTGIGRSRARASVFIQTDAAINPGNSGGALVDVAGKLVGINTLIYSRSGGSVGIGFAIPSNLVRLHVESAQSGRSVAQPWIGARLEDMTRELAEGLGLNRAVGALIARMDATGPAAKAGLQAGDVITRIDGFEVADAHAAYYRLTTRGIGNTAVLSVRRKGAMRTIDLPLAAPPKPGPDDVRNLSGNHPFDGARVMNLLPGVADELSIDESEGVAILSVRSGSIASRLRLRPRDVIVSVQESRVNSIEELERFIGQRQRLWVIGIMREGRLLSLEIPG